MSQGDITVCWPEQFPGEYKMAQKVWADADKKWPDRKRDCCHWNSDYYPCRHCATCGRFVSKIYCVGNEIGGMLVVRGTCKTHGEQSLDMTNWDWEFFEGGNDL